MIIKLIRILKLKLYPLKSGDVLMADCCDFNIMSGIEQVLHGLKDLNGNTLFTFWRGDNNYRLTIMSTSMPYYILKAEILTRDMDDKGQFVWKERGQERRIAKRKIHDMILEGSITRSKP